MQSLSQSASPVNGGIAVLGAKQGEDLDDRRANRGIVLVNAKDSKRPKNDGATAAAPAVMDSDSHTVTTKLRIPLRRLGDDQMTSFPKMTIPKDMAYHRSIGYVSLVKQWRSLIASLPTNAPRHCRGQLGGDRLGGCLGRARLRTV
jgi:hypothetical protein